MPYNLSIPGQVSELQLRAIEVVAALVPRNGTVVEVGSLFGSSSWAWAKSVDPSVTVFCIDPWQGNAGVQSIAQRHGVTYGLEQFRRYTADCPNIQPIQGYSPRDFADWTRPVDLYYEDAVHTNPVLAQNLDFWSSHLTEAGIICGDDYRPRFPDVRAGAQRLAQRFGRELIIVDFFWCLLPSASLMPQAQVAAAKLRDLADEGAAAKRARGPLLTVGSRAAIPDVVQGNDLTIPCTAGVQAVEPWPTAARGELAMSVTLQDDSGVASGSAKRGLGTTTLEPDIPYNVDLSLPTKELRPGRYQAVVSLLDEIAGTALAASRAFPIRVTPPKKSQGEGPPLKPGVEILFRVGGTAAPYLRSGWAAPEARHCWAIGLESYIAFQPDLHEEQRRRLAHCRLLLRLRPLVVPPRLVTQRLAISLNGEQVMTTSLAAPTEIAIDVPRDIAVEGTTAVLCLHHPDAARPRDLIESSKDSKLLSFAVEWAKLEVQLGA